MRREVLCVERRAMESVKYRGGEGREVLCVERRAMEGKVPGWGRKRGRPNFNKTLYFWSEIKNFRVCRYHHATWWAYAYRVGLTINMVSMGQV